MDFWKHFGFVEESQIFGKIAKNVKHFGSVENSRISEEKKSDFWKNLRKLRNIFDFFTFFGMLRKTVPLSL